MENLINKSFGKWTVISYAGIKSKKYNTWLCRCICGTEKIVYETNLKSGKSVSCGCFRVETGKVAAAKNLKGTQRKHPNGRIALATRVWQTVYRDGCSFEFFLKLSQEKCHYCGTEPNRRAKFPNRKNNTLSQEWLNEVFIYNGLDRINNNLGHTQDNLVPCCWDCNRAKLARSYSDFIKWIDKVYNNIHSKDNSNETQSYSKRVF